MLIGAFEIHIGGPFGGLIAHHIGMGAAGIEPDIENVGYLGPLAWIVFSGKEALSSVVLKPRIRAFLAEGVDDSGVDFRIAQDFNCLLYTSPSPRDATLSRMPSSA